MLPPSQFNHRISRDVIASPSGACGEATPAQEPVAHLLRAQVPGRAGEAGGGNDMKRVLYCNQNRPIIKSKGVVELFLFEAIITKNITWIPIAIL
jgi:hypothetical protein